MTEKNLTRVILAAFCVSGAAALIYEVAWTRALSLILGSTVYALSTLLATFMAGLAIGAYVGGRIADSKRNILAYFGFFELGIGFFGLITVPLIYRLPPVYLSMYKTFHLVPTLYFLFQFLLCAAIMLLPTTLMGATFPVVSKRVTGGIEELGRMVGSAYFVNTFGAIVGSLLAGFFLIPAFGIRNASFFAAGLNVTAGFVLLVISGVARQRYKMMLLIAALFAVTLPLAISVKSGSSLVSFYFASRLQDYNAVKAFEEKKTLLFEKDYAQGTIRAYSEEGLLTIQHGGKMEGTSPDDVPNTVMIAAIPAAAYGRKPEDMLVIGLGAGVTTYFAKEVAERVDVVEINPGVVEAVTRFGIPGTLEDVSLHLNDARNYLLVTDKKYDVITSELSVPSEAMSANLFSREYYEIVASRLKRGGVFYQWMPSWVMTRKDTQIAAKTFGSVFPNAYLWVLLTTHDFIMMGSTEPIPLSPDEIIERASRMDIQPPPNSKFIITPEMLRGGYEKVQLIRGPEGIRELVARADLPIITDDRPYLDFAVAKNLLLGPDYQKFRE